MKTITIQGLQLKVHDCEKEISEHRRSEFNRHLIELFGKGDGMTGLFERVRNLDAFNQAGEKQKVQQELINMRETMRDMWDKVDHRSLAFACLVAEVNGMAKNDFSQAALKNLLDELSAAGLTYDAIRETVEEVKKNWMPG